MAQNHFIAEDVCRYFEVPRTSISECIIFPEVSEEMRQFYGRHIEEGWRRYGPMLYRMRCPGCRLCIPLRINADIIKPSPSLNRILARNRDLVVTRVPATFNSLHYALWVEYSQWKHGLNREELSEESYRRFLSSWSVLFEYRVSGSLCAISIIDPLENGLSSVYFFFSPQEARRSLGFLSILVEAAIAAALELSQFNQLEVQKVAEWYHTDSSACCRSPMDASKSMPCERGWYYLGFWIPYARTMDYKARIAPFELALPVCEESGPYKTDETARRMEAARYQWLEFQNKEDAIRYLIGLKWPGIERQLHPGSLPHVDYSTYS